MRFILLTVSLFIAINSYAEIDKHNYIYASDDDELIKHKERLMIAKNKVAKHNLRMYKEAREKSPLIHDKSEVVFKVGDPSKKDIGAKIGMTTKEVLDNTYWGKADNVNTVTDKYGKLELWSYDFYGMLTFDNGKLVKINTPFSEGEVTRINIPSTQ